MVYASPGESRNFTIDGAPTGLAGQIGWTVENETDTVLVARSTTGTTEFAAGAYRKSLTLPDTKGRYVVLVDFPSGVVVTIEVEVTYDGQAPAAPTDHYFTVEELQASQTGIADKTEDQIEEARALAEQALEDACGVAFVPRTATETVDGSGAGVLLLKWARVREVTALTVDGAAETDLTGVLPHVAGVYTTNAFSYGHSNITITYEHGYDSPPLRIRRAAMRLAKHYLVDTPRDDRMVRLTDQEGGQAVYSVPGGKTPFGIPEVDSAVQNYSEIVSVG